MRNGLRALEEEHFLTHPHTSAGRIPTAAGYRFYLQQIDWTEVKALKQELGQLERAFGAMGDYETARKNIAKALVELSDQMVLIAFSPEKVYYTGLSNLFQKPDFLDHGLVINVSQVFDQCEEYLPEFFDEVENEPQFFVGDEHPFGEMLSVLSVRFGKKDESLLALFGPQRMDYKHTWGLMKKAKELI